MMENLLPTFSVWLLMLIGVALIVLEVLLVPFFVLLWFGIAAIVVGLVHAVWPFPGGEYQLITIGIVGVVLLLVFRKRFMAGRPTRKDDMETFRPGGIGKLRQYEGEWMVFYNGTWWKVMNVQPDFKDGSPVRVVRIDHNLAEVEKA